MQAQNLEIGGLRIVDEKVRQLVKPNLSHLRFVEQVQAHPDAPAVVFDGQVLTYRQLDIESSRLAHCLLAHGVARGGIVALYMTRGPELVACTLAVLKAGAACLFVEAAAEWSRVGQIVATVEPALLIAGALPGDGVIGPECPLVSIASLQAEAADRPLTPPEVEVTPSDLAFVFMTSGSSGVPKAVRFPHGWYYDAYGSPPQTERHILKTDSGTTFTRAEIMRPLVNGQTLYIAPPGREKNIRALAAYVAAHEITHLVLTPSALQAMLLTGDLKGCRALRFVLCSGERVSEHLQALFCAQLDAELVVTYGCTEAPGAASLKLGKNAQFVEAIAGRPTPLMDVRVLGPDLRPVERGAEGEVYIGGMIADGYHADPELTADKFIHVPDGRASELRMFRTGDRGRWHESGCLQILGRVDSQLKIRGYRVEPAEIEACAMQHPGVISVAVVGTPGASGELALVAHAVRRDPQLTESLLRAALAESLPQHMIPVAIRFHDALPVTSSGKIDRRALAELAVPGVVEEERIVPKGDPFEAQLKSMWQILLNVRHVGIKDNFFEIGGNSILAAQLIDQIERTFQRKLPLDVLWYHEGTIEALAKMLREQYEYGENPQLVPMREGSRRPLFVTHVRDGHLSDYYQLAHCLAPDQPVYGLQARGVFGRGRPDSSIEEIALNCIESMKLAQPKGPYQIAGYSSGGVVAYEMAQQLHRQGESVSLLVLIDTIDTSAFSSKVWKVAFQSALGGKTHPLRNLVYWGLSHYSKITRPSSLNDIRKAHRRAHMSYRPLPYEGRLVYILAEASLKDTEMEFLAWRDSFRPGVEKIVLPGTHGGLVAHPGVRALAEQLQRLMDEGGR
ncbi:AMP-binding protein [Azoarcus communis]|uniref:AMP-binding protein n=1 Tax=Parazoarcus communis TaxID=41977 RepID=UPI001459F06E|nr:AMP-binding protein [Parazoarcus communis]NMG50234.1 AMP-binding protein [Parazoarcus communis]